MKVRDQNWCFAIEIALGFNTLIGFIVDNQSDGDILRGLIKQTVSRHPGKPHPPVFTGAFNGRVYDVTRNVSKGLKYNVLINAHILLISVPLLRIFYLVPNSSSIILIDAPLFLSDYLFVIGSIRP